MHRYNGSILLLDKCKCKKSIMSLRKKRENRTFIILNVFSNWICWKCCKLYTKAPLKISHIRCHCNSIKVYISCEISHKQTCSFIHQRYIYKVSHYHINKCCTSHVITLKLFRRIEPLMRRTTVRRSIYDRIITISRPISA